LKPLHRSKISDAPILLSLISRITNIECSNYFSEHLGKLQKGKKSTVSEFQDHVKSILEHTMPEIEWISEHRVSLHIRDSIDIFGQGQDFVVVIELDAHRADQVAKKFVSRVAILSSTTIYYISLCYPGTKKMSIPECNKYFDYCAILAGRMGHHYADFIIE
jgi:hypothetical protein